MIGWNSSPPELKEDLHLMMCNDVNAISIFKEWLSKPGLERPKELNYYEDLNLLKLLINLIQDDQVFCAKQAQNILRTFCNLLGS